MDFLTRANQAKVTADLLGEAMEMHASLPVDGHSAVGRTVRLFELLDRKCVGKKKRADTALAIELRLTALVRLLQDQDARSWTMLANDEGADLIHRDLIQAAAEEPLIEDADHQAAFNPQTFRARVLKIAKAEGEA